MSNRNDKDFEEKVKDAAIRGAAGATAGAVALGVLGFLVAGPVGAVAGAKLGAIKGGVVGAGSEIGGGDVG